MGFRCSNCGVGQVPGTVPIRRVVETRNKEYPAGGRGWEIVKEATLCQTCAPSVVDKARPKAVRS